MNTTLNAKNSSKNIHAINDFALRAEINARLEMEDQEDQDFLAAADERALSSFMKALKANPLMTKSDSIHRAKIDLAAEHGLDFDDLNDDWGCYIGAITSHHSAND